MRCWDGRQIFGILIEFWMNWNRKYFPFFRPLAVEAGLAGPLLDQKRIEATTDIINVDEAIKIGS